MKIRRMFATILCLALVLSMSVVAFAATSKTFFSKQNGYGYTIRGSGKINGATGTSTLNLTASTTNLSIAEKDLVSYATIAIYDANGNLAGYGTGSKGTTYATVSLSATTNLTKIQCSYTSNGTSYGTYDLSA